MNITIENFIFDTSFLTVDYTTDGRFESEQFLLDDFEKFCRENDLMDWDEMIFRNREYVDDVEGTYEFEEFCREHCTEKEIKLFVEWKLK